jgi:predicted RNA-binding protein with PIN domain
LKTFLIDGYNLLHQIPELAGSPEENLESRRERLVLHLAARASHLGAGLKIVFDGKRPHRSRGKHPGIEVQFVAGTADQFMRQVISRHEHDKNLVIVSSDRKDIGSYAQTCGLEWMTSEQFWIWLGRPRRVPKEPSGREEDGSAPAGWKSEDDEELRKAFGDE